MKLNNILAVVRNDLRIIRRVKWRTLEITYFPLTTILIWGLFALHSKQYAFEAGLIVLIVNLFWSFCHIAQQQANILLMEDLWSLSIKHVFIAGVSEFEYLIAKLVTSTSAAIVIGTLLLFVANAFGAPLFANLQTVLVLAGIALLGSIALAIFVAGTIMISGREYGFLSWSAMQLFVFLSAPFFSPRLFPAFLQWASAVMPFTNVFEIARALATRAPIQSAVFLKAFVIVVVYLLASLPYYAWACKRARKTGVLARMAH
ncbi:ABC transporter permease [Candidatus Woesearchaeota archaeon]|nr:ABC transporter permease [Candidatus Woesearchaeota archaeon]